MRRGNIFASFLPALALTLLYLQSASAQPPDLLRSYRFIPRLSTLHQTGGIAGFDFRLPISGSYDFITGFGGAAFSVPTLKPYAEFADVEATVKHPHYHMPQNIDRFLNLSGLDGAPVIHDGPKALTVYRFSGNAGDAKVNLHVATLGRWMFMRGGTTPPCCDFFQYDIKAISHQIPYGDFDGDGNVGASDLATWQTGFDVADNALSGHDFLDWQRSFGETAPTIAEFEVKLEAALAAANTVATTAVPEPASLLLIVVGATWVISTGRLAR